MDRFEWSPDLMRAERLRINSLRMAGRHIYRVKFIQYPQVVLSRRWFKRASEAEAYGQRVLERYKRMKSTKGQK